MYYKNWITYLKLSSFQDDNWTMNKELKREIDLKDDDDDDIKDTFSIIIDSNPHNN